MDDQGPRVFNRIMFAFAEVKGIFGLKLLAFQVVLISIQRRGSYNLCSQVSVFMRSMESIFPCHDLTTTDDQLLEALPSTLSRMTFVLVSSIKS